MIFVLALTRKKSESIMIGDNVEVVVLGIAGEQVKIGISAPREISVHRKEIFEQIQEENRQAAMTYASELDIRAVRDFLRPRV